MKAFLHFCLLFLSVLKDQRGFFRPGLFCMSPEGDGSGGGGGTGDNQNKDNGNNGDNKDSKEDIESLPEWAKSKLKAYESEVGNLRKENGSRRVENKSLSERLGKIESGLKKSLGVDDKEEVDLNEKVTGLTNQLMENQLNHSIIEMAYENEIPKDQIPYFKFLLNESFAVLGEEEELPEERLKEIVQKVKGVSQKPANSSVNGGANNDPSKDQKKDYSKITPEQFAKMGDSEKNTLFKTDRSRYDALFLEAKQKRLFRFN